MQERLICCCGSSGWSRVIGWFQTIGNAMMVLIVGYNLGILSYVTASHPDILDEAYPAEAGDAESRVTMLFLLLVTLFILTIIATAMGVVLLRGSYHSRPDLLKAWIIYAHIGLIAGLVIMVGRSFYAADCLELGVQISSMALTVLIQGFCIWVVRTHKIEIEMDYQRMGPMKA